MLFDGEGLGGNNDQAQQDSQQESGSPGASGEDHGNNDQAQQDSQQESGSPGAPREDHGETVLSSLAGVPMTGSPRILAALLRLRPALPAPAAAGPCPRHLDAGRGKRVVGWAHGRGRHNSQAGDAVSRLRAQPTQ
ncbi:hypothetical protein N2152v2_006485 [Parachlorella kessleri]